MQEGTEGEAPKIAPSLQVILNLLKEKGQLTPKEIIEETGMANRTVSFALRKLIKLGKIKKRKLIQFDQRSPVYCTC